MPILYIPVPELFEDDPTDDLMQVVKDIQWKDWTALRFVDRSSGDYQEATHGLAQELHRRITAVEQVDIVAALEAADVADPEGESAGVLDRLAELEEAMPRWTDTLGTLAAEIERIGNVMSAGSRDMDAGERSGKGFAARLTVARRVATELVGPVDRIAEAGQDFANGLSQIDAGVRTVVEESVRDGVDVTNPEFIELDAFFASIRTLATAAQSGLGATAGMIESAQPLERLSKDMRPPLRKLRTALTSLVQAQQTTDAWIALLDEHSFGLSAEGQSLADKWGDAKDADTGS